MISQLTRPVSQAVRSISQRSILRSGTAAPATLRFGSHVAHELTPRQEEEANLTTYDSQNTPEGPWAEGMARQQAHYNKVLLVGVGVFISTLIFGRILRDDMYWVDKPIPMTNPPPFSLKEMEEEALAALEEED